MVDFPFSWQLQYSSIMDWHPKKDLLISEFKINSEWSLICLRLTPKPYIPVYLKICRNSTAKEILISGNFKLMRNSNCVLQRKFVQLIEAGSANTLLDLEHSAYNTGNTYYNTNAKYSISGTLTIPAEVIQGCSKGAEFKSFQNLSTNPECTKGAQLKSLQILSSDFEGLLDPEATNFSDVNLKCEAVSFPVHKSILSARSPVFTAMFTTEMRENLDNKIVIVDMSPNILKILLVYIYTGKTEKLCFQTASELLFAADKYQLQDLKRVCSDYLKSCVSTQNVFNTLVLGYLHDQDLKDFALNFICNNSGDFDVMEKTMDWKNLREKRPELAMDVLTSLVKSNNKKMKERGK